MITYLLLIFFTNLILTEKLLNINPKIYEENYKINHKATKNNYYLFGVALTNNKEFILKILNF